MIEDNFRYQNNIDVEIYDSLGVDYRRTLTQRHIPEYVINEYGAEIYGNAHLVAASQPDTGEDLAIFKEDESNSDYSIGWHIWATSVPSGNLSLSVIKTEVGPIPFASDFIPWKASPTATSVLYTAQSLTEEQQAQARTNIGAGTSYILPQASSDAIGGVKADSAEAADTQPVRIGGDGKLYTTPGITDISTKMDANNPVGTGSFSMNRKADTKIGTNSHAEGGDTTASGGSSHAEGVKTTASGYSSHAEGDNTTASGISSHAEGVKTTASVKSSHAEGSSTTASGGSSHAEGGGTTAKGQCSHAEGGNTTASGNFSHAEGGNTTASGNFSHVQGKFNIEDTSSIYADIIGNGTSNDARSNAYTLDWNGNAWFAGDVYTGSTSGTNKDDGSKKLATEEYVDNSIAAGGGTDISLGLTSAAVGQTIKVKAIDESGKPTAWEAADMSESIALDTTLTQSGQAADAKAVGDALAEKQSKGDYLTQDNLQSATNAALEQAKASGEFDGADGTTPHIGYNGNWFVGSDDTGKPSRGETGPQGVSGVYVGSGDMPEGYNVQIDPDGTPNLASETWTFTLDDDTTVTKVVVLQ